MYWAYTACITSLRGASPPEVALGISIIEEQTFRMEGKQHSNVCLYDN